MATENGRIKEIGRLLFAQKPAEARDLMAKETVRLEGQIKDLKDKLSDLTKSLKTLRDLTPDGGIQPSLDIGDTVTLTKSQKRQRTKDVIQAAREIGSTTDEFTSEDVAILLAEKGVEVVSDAPGQRSGARGTATSIYIRDPEGNRIELRHY